MRNLTLLRSKSTVSTQVGTALVSTCLLLGAALVSTPAAYSAEPEVRAQSSSPQTSATPGSASTLPDGVYLYGQSSKPDEIGKGYFVFESKQGAVTGALYMPNSSFDCAKGTFKESQLALTVTDSYDRTTNPFEIALERTSTVATGSNPAIREVGLQGFYKLDTISANDQRILNTCKADLQGQAKK